MTIRKIGFCHCICTINIVLIDFAPLDSMTVSLTLSFWKKKKKEIFASVQQLRGGAWGEWKRNLIAPLGIFQSPEIMHAFDLLLVNTQGRRSAIWPAVSLRHLFGCKKWHQMHRQSRRGGTRCVFCGLSQLLCGEWDVYMSPKWRMIE